MRGFIGSQCLGIGPQTEKEREKLNKNLKISPALGGRPPPTAYKREFLVIFQYIWPVICQNRLIFHANLFGIEES